jgi:hypothetical protein
MAAPTPASTAVSQEQEDELCAQSLRDAGVHRLDGPLAAQQHRDDRGQQLDEQRGAGLADDEAAQDSAQQPDAGDQTAEARRQRVEGQEARVAGEVPEGEDQTDHDAQDGGDDDVEGAPAVAAGTGRPGGRWDRGERGLGGGGVCGCVCRRVRHAQCLSFDERHG